MHLYDSLSPLDWWVFFIILGITFFAVILGHFLRKSENILDLLIMGRQMTLPFFVATLVATWYGGIFGVTQIAFEKGIYNFVTQGLCWYLAYFIFAFFLVRKLAPYRAVTLPDLVHKMFGPLSSKLSAVFNFFNVLPISYVISLGLFLQMIFGGHLAITMSAGVATVLLYSSRGGLRAVVFSDVVQFTVMYASVAIVLIVSFSTFGGFGFLQAHLPATHFKIKADENWGNVATWALIALSTLVDPNFYQRCFAAKNPAVAKKGILISIALWVGFDICTTIGAMYARAVLPPDVNSSQAYVTYALQILPAGLRGLFLAGILATILSTLDSYLLLARVSLTYDLALGRAKNLAGLLFVGGLSVAMALVFDHNIKLVWKTLGSYSASCLLLPMMAGHLFPRKISDRQFFLSSLSGAIAVTYWNIWGHTWAPEVDSIYIGLLTTSLSLALSVALYCKKPR